MLRIRLLVVGLFVVTWLAGDAAHSSLAAEGRFDAWRQTRDGWQRSDNFLAPPIEYRRPALHPLVVGLLEILLTITAMLTFSDRRGAIEGRIASTQGVRLLARPSKAV